MSAASRSRALAWATLAQSGLPAQALVPLLAAWPDPEALLAAPPAALRRQAPEAAVARLARARDDPMRPRIEAWLADPAHEILGWDDPDFPQLLLTLPDVPAALYLIGRRDVLNRPAVAIVGSRHATPGGMENARAFAHALGTAGLAIVSGLALGIDGAAHEAALQTPASTIAVLGTGLDRVYPARHRTLAHAIAARGALLSEFAPGTPALRQNFPQRNRLISGLARGVLVVEATLSSGSLITARHAANQGRDVYAIPGSIHSPFARGCHRLIRDGAKLVETAADVLVELGMAQPATTEETAPRGRRLRSARSAPTVSASPTMRPSGAPALSGDEATVLKALGHDPADADTLIERTGMPAGAVGAALVSLELAGEVHALPAGRFERSARANAAATPDVTTRR